jgi:hypothetical protein
MSLRDELRQDWDAPSIEDEALLESLTGDVRRAFLRFVRSEIVEAFDEGVTEGEILGLNKQCAEASRG